MFTRILILVMLVTAAACAPNPVQNATPIPPTQGIVEEPTVENTEEAPSPVPEGGLQKKFTAIVSRDLATRLSVDAESISVISVEPIEWPNSALGCPAPGKVYTQGTVPGFRIRLEVEDQEYSYHTDRNGQFLLCPENNVDLPEEPSIPVEPGEIDDGQPWVPVD
jgi:hypothetical protein